MPNPSFDDMASTMYPNMRQDAPFGYRPDGTPKGRGFFGALKRPDGGVMTEYSIGVNIDGRDLEIPTLVPTLTKSERDLLLRLPDGELPPRSIQDKAIQFARKRLSEGKPVFAEPNESPKP